RPAHPNAESRPPIVVGIRHTSNAISTVIVTADPAPLTCTLKTDIGYSVTHTSRNISVSATSRIVSAISLGVLRRFALSTIAIIRSRNVSPGSAVTHTTSQSDSTRVPPVTAQKSEPAARITGADSPVIALS